MIYFTPSKRLMCVNQDALGPDLDNPSQFQTECIISEPERFQYADEETAAALCFPGTYSGLFAYTSSDLQI